MRNLHDISSISITDEDGPLPVLMISGTTGPYLWPINHNGYDIFEVYQNASPVTYVLKTNYIDSICDYSEFVLHTESLVLISKEE